MKRIIIFLSSLFFLNACSVIFGQQPRDLKIIEFDYEGHLEERKMAYDFFLKKGINMPWMTFGHVGVGFFDLNRDGKDEVFAYINGKDMCPMSGCPVAIFKKVGKFYKAIDQGGGTRTPPRILDSVHNDYHDLAFGDRRKDPEVHIWKWDGEKYH
ncbi:MAG TPA: hypothetical protein QKA08_04090 [Candidatus Megaira endosymbiont of Nemacystus decipiens]|nr:hypothetical protein [Candidatus Megaera endosymbiont of Nemacystus decipiens]